MLRKFILSELLFVIFKFVMDCFSCRSTASDHQLAHIKQQKMIALKKLQMEEEEEEDDDERFVMIVWCVVNHA
jgi:hypothetical protein